MALYEGSQMEEPVKRMLLRENQYEMDDAEKQLRRVEYLEWKKREFASKLEKRSFKNTREMVNARAELLQLEKEINANRTT